MSDKKNIMDILKERGFIKQVVYEDELYNMLETQSVPFYIGFDPTADSLHVGHFLALMAMSHMQKAGHKPIVLIGGGTGKIGDPSGRTDMRKMMTDETINNNCNCFKKQMSRFFNFEGENAAIMVNNADWLDNLKYIEFIRNIGSLFSVNKMLTAECFKTRMEKGLSFLEFNYMLMQSYDFLYLYEKYGCALQCGGDDQWSNILAGADLIRRKLKKPAFAMTFTLLTTSEGKKMGKTQKGALWLDKEKTTPYEFFQYWRNVNDDDVKKCFKLLTFLELNEINSIVPVREDEKTYDGTTFEKKINEAKERLAFEITKIIHGEDEAKQVLEQVKAAFIGNEESMQQVIISNTIIKITDILLELKLVKSKSEAKRLIEGGGVKINSRQITSIDEELSDSEIMNGFVLHKGKKNHIKVNIE